MKSPVDIAGKVSNVSSSDDRDQMPSMAGTIAYAAPTLASCFLYAPLWVVLPAVYAKYFGLPLTNVAAVVLFARIFDGITDTTIGYLADRHRAAGGSRKPWVIGGGIVMVVSCYFLFAPLGTVTTSYYLVWSLVFFLGFTMMEIPHLAWGTELTMCYNQRAKVFNIRYIFWGTGSALFYALPLLPIYDTNEYTPGMLKDAAVIGGLAMLVLLSWMYLFAPVGNTLKLDKKDSTKQFIRSIVDNKALLVFLAGYSCIGLSSGMFFGAIYIYLDGYLGAGSWLAIGFFGGGIVGVACLPLWQKIIERTSKITTWAIGIFLYSATLGGLVFISPGDAGWLIAVIIGSSQIGLNCQNAAAAATLGDIIDYGKLKFRQDRSSIYFAANNLVVKLTVGMGSGAALAIAGWYGFDPTQTTHSATAIFGLQLSLLYLPLLLGVFAITFILLIPITKRRHEIIRRRLAVRMVGNDSPSIQS